MQLDGQTWAIEAKSGEFDAHAVDGTFAKAERYLSTNTQFVVATTGTEKKRLHLARVLPWQVLLNEMGL